MMHTLLKTSLIVVLCLLTFDANTQPDDLYTRAQTLFGQGNEAYDAGDYTMAREKYLSAFTLRPRFDYAANLGWVELKLARH